MLICICNYCKSLHQKMILHRIANVHVLRYESFFLQQPMTGYLISLSFFLKNCPLGLGCRIHWLFLSRGVRLPKRASWYDTKQFDGEAQVMLELWRMWSTPELPSLSGPLTPGLIAPDRVVSMGQIELNCVLMLNWTVWIRTVFAC